LLQTLVVDTELRRKPDNNPTKKYPFSFTSSQPAKQYKAARPILVKKNGNAASNMQLVNRKDICSHTVGVKNSGSTTRPCHSNMRDRKPVLKIFILTACLNKQVASVVETKVAISADGRALLSSDPSG